MFEKIENLVYRMKFFGVIRIYLIIFIIQLKLILDRFENFYYKTFI